MFLDFEKFEGGKYVTWLNTTRPLVLYSLYWVFWGGVQEKEVKRKDCSCWCTGLCHSLHLSHIIINSIKYTAWISSSATRICNLSFVVICVPNSANISISLNFWVKWQIGNCGLESGAWHACRGCFEWLTGYRNKQKDTERYILQAKVKMVKKWHKILNYSINEQYSQPLKK